MARAGRSPLLPRARDPVRSRAPDLMLVLALVVLCMAGGVLGGDEESDRLAVRCWQSTWRRCHRPLPPRLVATRLPIPLSGETALVRARALAAGGHLRDALAELDRVRPTDGQRTVADRLRADIQRQLIGLASAGAEACAGRPGEQRRRTASMEVPQVRLPGVRERGPVPQLRVRLLADLAPEPAGSHAPRLEADTTREFPLMTSRCSWTPHPSRHPSQPIDRSRPALRQRLPARGRGRRH